MRKLRYAILIIAVFALLCGCGKTEETDQKTEADFQSFAQWSEFEIFEKVPALLAENTRIKEARDAGGKNYVIEVNGTDTKIYEDYLKLLESKGFKKYVDNGEKGLDNGIFVSTYTKDSLVLTVSYMKKVSKIFVSVGEDIPLSEHLFYKDEYVAGNVEGAKTSLRMLEMYDFGNSFVLQLKNGHFIVNDGGLKEDLVYLLEYLESHAPNGEKPIVEGWFISHGHTDHVGCLIDIAKHTDWAKRICVEGFYFSQPNDALCKLNGDTGTVSSFMMACKVFRTTKGEKTQTYRPHAGEVYYFNDITVDIVFTQDIFQVENSFAKAFNDTSTWLMYNIEGQKTLLPADADALAQECVYSLYSKDYLTVDILQAFHHGYNVNDAVSDNITFKTVIYPFFTTDSTLWRKEIQEGNKILRETAVECFCYDGGTKVITYPYTIGSYTSEPVQKWAHHPDRVPSKGISE